MNPGRNGIFDFLRRDLATYQPDFAMYLIGSKRVLWGKNNHLLVALVVFAVCVLLGTGGGRLARRAGRGLWVGALVGLVIGGSAIVWARDVIPYRQPTVENTRKGDTFWEIAGRHGVRSKVVRVPATFPARAYDLGHLLSGLGVPDIRGTFGTFTLYTTESLPDRRDENTEMGGKIIQVSLLNGETESYVFGPRNRLFDEPPEIFPPIHFRVDRTTDPHTVAVTLQGKSETIPLGGWSEWFTIEFRMSPIISLYGIARFNFISSEPFILYMSSINLDPHSSPLPISAPKSWSGELATRFGLYKTLGWAMDTWALNELHIDEETFLEDVYSTEGKFGEIMRGLLEDEDYRLYVHVYELTDRVAHVFWRFLDPTHPAHDPELAATYGDAIRDSYVFMDERVGEAMERMGPDDILFVLSDHGFHTWHKAVNYNTWLVQNGYMTLKSSRPDTEKKLEDLFGQGQFWPNVDWRRTKAYAMGLGDVYLNVKGREAQGIVEPGAEYERIRDQLIVDLERWVDPETGDHPVRRAQKREEVYRGYDDDLIPDLLLGNNPKYRVSWQTSLGGIPPDLMQINDRKWSGDHCSFDAAITKGILFSNRKLEVEEPTILDLFPTILGYLDIPLPEDRDGKALEEL
jgi:predicted AlkP superfamily phosphohydrolase/phosphomutase